MHRTRSSSPRALYTSLEVAEVRDTCVPPRNTYSPNPHELTTYDSKHTYALPIQHNAMRYTSGIRDRYDGRSPGHCAVTDRWIVPINKRGSLPGILSDILECPRFLTCPRTWHLPTYLYPHCAMMTMIISLYKRFLSDLLPANNHAG